MSDKISPESRRLRMLTYMCPEIPYENFAFLRDAIEEATGLECDLICEDRFTGPTASRRDPFSNDLADIVIPRSSSYFGMRKSKHSHVELCQAAPVYKHPRASDRAIYFSEIIINAINKEKYKDMATLKGCSWAYSDNSSISGNLVVLGYLKKSLGSNATYFGSIIESGSHRNSIKMVRDYQVEAAAVDSTVLAGYLREHPDHEHKFISLVTLGPLPSPPILFNAKMPSELKTKITDFLLSLGKSDKWAERLQNVGISKFVPNDEDLYMLEDDIVEQVEGMKINTAYY